MPMTQQLTPPFAGVPQEAQSALTLHEEGQELPPEELPLEELLPEPLPEELLPPEPEEELPEELLAPEPKEELPEELPPGEMPPEPEAPPPEELPLPLSTGVKPVVCGVSVPQATSTPSTRHQGASSLSSDEYFMRAFLLVPA